MPDFAITRPSAAGPAAEAAAAPAPRGLRVPGLGGYAAAAAITALALLLRLALSTWLGPPYILFYPAVLLSGLLFGTGPGLLSVALSAALSVAFILPAERSAPGMGAREAGSLLAFVAMGLFMTWVARRHRLARARIAAHERAAALREAEELLQASERALRISSEAAGRGAAQLEAVFQAVGDGIAVFDLSRRLVLLNEAQARINGFASVEEMRRDLSWFAQVYELRTLEGHLLPVAEWPVSRVFRGEVVSDWELRGRRRDTGREWVFSFGGQPIRDEQGQVVLAVVTTRDVTARRRAEEALRASEGRLRLLVEHAPAAVALFDRELRFLAVSRRFLDHTRPGERDVVGRTMYQVFPEIPPRWREIHSRCLTGAVERCEEDEFRHADGRVDWVRWEIHPWRDAAGEVGGLVLFSETITERLEAARALAAERERLARSEQRHRLLAEHLSAILDTSIDAFWVVGAEGRILRANEAASALTGYPMAELLSMQVADLDAAESPAEVAAHMALIAERGADRFESRLRRKDGAVIDTEVSAQRAHLDGGRIIAFLRDITEARRAREALQQAQKLESVGRLAGGVAHDFNNLLTVILSGVEELKLSAALRGPDAEVLDEIGGAGLRARDLTTQLLAFARKQAAAPVPLDLGEAVGRAGRLLRRLLGDQVQLRTRLAPALWPVRCDPVQLEQVVVNLAVNARDAMPAGGELAIETGNLEVAGERSGHPGLRPGPHVRLAVRDRGVGMPPEVMAHLFEPFFTTKGLGKGTGLGLATVYGIVRQNGGSIAVESAPGRGTTFEILFPRCPAAPAAGPPP